MIAVSWDIQTASEEWLVNFCHQAEKQGGIMGNPRCSDRVVKLSDDIAVKFGPGVTASEFETQEFAHQLTDPSLVHIPRVFRFFRRNDPVWACGKGYMFMEYVAGPGLDQLDLDKFPGIIPYIAKIIQHFGRLQHSIQVPGPLGGGEPDGYLWGEDGAGTSFTCRADLEAYLNRRLALWNKSIILGSWPLVLCHMDLCRRNMILDEDNRICVVDWGFAGFYPQYFEIASLSWLNPYDRPYEKSLVEATTRLVGFNAEAKQAVGLLGIVRASNLQFTF